MTQAQPNEGTTQAVLPTQRTRQWAELEAHRDAVLAKMMTIDPCHGSGESRVDHEQICLPFYRAMSELSYDITRLFAQ